MKVLLTLLLLLAGSSIYSADITGTVRVDKKRSGDPLQSFENTIVFLAGPPSAPPPTAGVINQIDKTFTPRLLPIVKGQKVEFWNRDKVQHNVFSTDRRNPFDLGRYPKDEKRDTQFNELGMYKVYCNIHQAMITDVVVVPNPHYALTDKDGTYTIRQVPAGRHELRAWNIFGGRASTILSVAKETVQKDFHLVSEKIIRELESHTDKDGKRYKRKSGRYAR